MEARRRARPALRALWTLPVLPVLRALPVLLWLLAGPAAAYERPHCRPHTNCTYTGENSDNYYFFKVNGRTLNIFYDESKRTFSVRCDEGGEPGPAAAADERALPALPALTAVDFAEFQGCRPPAGAYDAALRALNVRVGKKLWLLRLPAEPRLARAQLAGLRDLRELKLSSGRPPAPPLRPAPDFLAELPRLTTLRLYRVEPARALARLPGTLRQLELHEAGLAAAERELAALAAPGAPHWLEGLQALQFLTLIEQHGELLAPPPLAALPRLLEASLQVPLGALPPRWLAGSSLQKLYLTSCGLSDLSGLPFDRTNLTVLNVSRNNLTDLPTGVFGSLQALWLLSVSGNKLSRAALERALPPLASTLRELDASFNPLASLCDFSPIARGREFSKLPRTLRRLVLRNTEARRLCADWLNSPDLAHIDLRDNLIESLDYDELVMERRPELAAAGVRLLLSGNNRLRELAVGRDQLAECRAAAAAAAEAQAVNKTQADDEEKPDTVRALVKLSLPPLHCACANAPLRALLRDCPEWLRLTADVNCTDGTKKFLEHDSDDLLCKYEHECISGCSCGAWRLSDNATVLQCAGAVPGPGWAGWPGWAAASRARPLALLVPGAGLLAVPGPSAGAGPGPLPLVELLAPDNNIAALDEQDIPDTLQELDLRNNNITRVSAAAAARLRGVRTQLAGNPFACACADQPALAALRDADVSDWGQLRCGGAGALRGRLLAGVRRDELCRSALPWLLGGGLAACALLAAAAAALWPRARPRLKQFLFERQLCLGWVLGADDEVDDPAKTHDAFVSYAHQDHARAAQVLRGLEARGYSTLEHCRDWLPGAAVAEHIARSVLGARRTLLLVSDHYGNSKWALEEFRAAHAHALERRSARVLLLRCGLRAPERLPPDLQLHLRLNTYLDVEDPGFWRKLCRAMPPPRAAPAPPPADPAPAPGELRLWVPAEGDKPRLWTPPAPRAAPLAGKPPRVLTPPPPRAQAAERLRRLLSPATPPPPPPVPDFTVQKHSFAAQMDLAPRAAPAC